jgi:hypothetical protein
MDLLIASKPNKRQYTNTFVIKTKFMHGDADSYSYKEFASNRQDSIKLAVKALKEVYAQHHNNRGKDSMYLPDWYEQAMEASWNDLKGYEDEGFFLLAEDSIPCDSEYSEGAARLEGYALFWYDEVGLEYNVA